MLEILYSLQASPQEGEGEQQQQQQQQTRTNNNLRDLEWIRLWML